MSALTDDAQWLAKAAAGEQEGFRELYRRHRPIVVRLLSSFGELGPAEVEDVVQETFVRAFRHLAKLKNPAAFEPWLLSIARNRALTLLKRLETSRRIREAFAKLVSDQPPEMTRSEERLELDRAAVRELISELPQGAERETVELFYVEGELSAREIAEKLGVAKSTVTSRLERFRAKVKRLLLSRLLERNEA